MLKTALALGLVGLLIAIGRPGTAADHREAPMIAIDLSVDDDAFGTFDLSGIGTETRIVEFESPDDSLVRKVPGKTRYTTLTLKRGVTSDLKMWDWRQALLGGDKTPRDGSFTYLDGAGKQVRVDVKGMLILSVTMGNDERMADNEIAVETIEIAHEGFTVR